MKYLSGHIPIRVLKNAVLGRESITYKMSLTKKIPGVLFCLAVIVACVDLSAQEPYPFKAKASADNTNIRTDSTVSAAIICTVNKNEVLEVVWELYEWYKIKLPAQAEVFVKKSLTSPIDDKSAKITKERVNLRLKPDESSAVLGKANKEDTVYILGERQGWYKIKPTDKSFGWIHKKFAEKIPEPAPAEQPIPAEEEAPVNIDKDILDLEGLLKPKIIRGIATHKLITGDKKIYLLKGAAEKLDAFSRHRVKIKARPCGAHKNTPILEIIETELSP